jgi:Spy/CpxP family protein refolding chaperone
MTLSRWAIGGYLALVFGSGAVVGALSHRMYTVSGVIAKSNPSPDEWRKNYMAEMKTRLKLRDDQILRLNILLDETRSRVREVHERHRPEIDEIKREQTVKVSTMLDPVQKVEFDKLVKERDERAERERQQQQEQEREKPAVPPQGPAGSPEHDLL